MRIITISGFSGSGKDTVSSKLVEKFGLKEIISTTSRPMRSTEKDHVDYHFITQEDFERLIELDRLVEHRTYNTVQDGKPALWHYGITKDEINDWGNYVVVVDLKGLSDLRKAYGNNVVSIFIDVDESTRCYRAVQRDANFELAEWNRRWEDDKKIFQDIENHNVDLMVENYDLNKCMKEIIEFLVERSI